MFKIGSPHTCKTYVYLLCYKRNNEPTQLLNVTFNVSHIVDCQVLKYSAHIHTCEI